METEASKKQGVVGFKVVKFDSRKTKDSEKLRVILEADIDDVKCGAYNVGDFYGALEHHKSGEHDVGFGVFMRSKVKDAGQK